MVLTDKETRFLALVWFAIDDTPKVSVTLPCKIKPASEANGDSASTQANFVHPFSSEKLV